METIEEEELVDLLNTHPSCLPLLEVGAKLLGKEIGELTQVQANHLISGFLYAYFSNKGK